MAFIDEPLAKLRTDALGHQLKLASKTAGAKANRATNGEAKPQGPAHSSASGTKTWKANQRRNQGGPASPPAAT